MAAGAAADTGGSPCSRTNPPECLPVAVATGVDAPGRSVGRRAPQMSGRNAAPSQFSCTPHEGVRVQWHESWPCSTRNNGFQFENHRELPKDDRADIKVKGVRVSYACPCAGDPLDAILPQTHPSCRRTLNAKTPRVQTAPYRWTGRPLDDAGRRAQGFVCCTYFGTASTRRRMGARRAVV